MSFDFSGLVLGPAMAIFGDDVLFRAVESNPNAAEVSRRGVFDEAHEMIRDTTGGGGSNGGYSDQVPMSTVGPVLGIKLDDWPGPPPVAGDEVTVKGKAFEIYDVQPDGSGHADLILKAI